MAEQENTTVVAKKTDFEIGLTNSLMSEQSALPKDLNVARFVQNSVALLTENDTLLKFSKENGTTQIKKGMLKAAFLGLDFMNKEAYLIPYGKQLNFMIDYRGAKKLAKKYSIRPIKDIYAKMVREEDDFKEYIVAGEQKIDFTPKPFGKGKYVGAFAVVIFADGGMNYETMNMDELNACKSKSKAQNSMAWKDFPGEMYKKTVLHRLCKGIEIEFESPNQRELFDEDVSIETDNEKIVERDIAENANSEEFQFDDTDVSETVENPKMADQATEQAEDAGELPDFLK